ncbi:MAG: ABC transporter permease [Actinomycetota bacterium]|nr:ABC transporter permease [Actinomycetota bacterium]
MASEWTKFRTVRSTVWTLATTLVLGVGLGAIATATTAARWQQMSVLERITFDPTRTSLTGILFAQLAVGILGVLVVTAEYGTGTIRATFAAVPRRQLVLAGKVAVFGSVVLVVGEAVSFAAFGVGQLLLAPTAPTAALGDPGVTRAVVGGGLYLLVLGLLALGIAAMVRHTAGAIGAFVAVLLVLPIIVAALPSSIGNALGRYLPANIGVVLLSVAPQQHSFTPWVGLLVLAGYALAALSVGLVLVIRRDA